ncbi:MAG: D-amino acid dehydrogenase [Betaproteobacteria bacterium]|nr:D-amino acid dehydrogenase [Betaproteobacteria bacterium]
MKVIVFGAGVVGVAGAWFLSKAGHEVTVVERQYAAGLETSFANGGQISVSHAEPWANPGALAQLVKWLGREDAPLVFRLRADMRQWRWGLRFLFECLPWRNRSNIIGILRLALYSRTLLKALRAETGIQYDHSERGILHFYTERAQLDAAHAVARLMTEFGCERRPKTPQEMVAIEPALAHALPHIVGGDYAPDDEVGDACMFTQRLAALCKRRGVKFLYGATIERLARSGDRIDGVCIRRAVGDARMIAADAYVVALGSYSPLLLRPLGIEPLIYPVKGYSVTIPITNPDAAPHVSLTDDGHKLVFSRLGGRLRVAGTAELNDYDTSVNQVRCDAILRRTAELFPQAGGFGDATRWAGLRPATPSNLPYVGGTPYHNLFLNTGHGTLGWTLACGSGHVLADVVSGRAPAIDAAAYAVTR